MKTFIRILSYAATALLACALTLQFCGGATGISKLDQIAYLIQTRFIGEYDPDKVEDAAAAAMIRSLGDEWSYYLSADEFASHMEQTENAYVGIGITIAAAESGEGYQVIELQPNGSAMEAGMLLGDIVISAEGQSAQNLTVAELRNIIRGKEGTLVTVTVLRDGETITFELERRQILVQVVSSQMLEENIGLITIRNFDERCAQESIAAIEQLREQGAEALIFDVRNNPGGYATELVTLLDYLLPEGELFHTVDYSGKEQVDYSDASCLELPIAVVCNSRSYSAAEFFPAAIQEYGAGTVVGTPTYGKGYFQYTFQLSDGSGIGLSVGKYYTPSGRSLAGEGIQPDILIEVDEETEAAIYNGLLEPQDDPQIQAAVAALGG